MTTSMRMCKYCTSPIEIMVGKEPRCERHDQMIRRTDELLGLATIDKELIGYLIDVHAQGNYLDVNATSVNHPRLNNDKYANEPLGEIVTFAEQHRRLPNSTETTPVFTIHLRDVAGLYWYGSAGSQGLPNVRMRPMVSRG